jgi:hypothetical protein
VDPVFRLVANAPCKELALFSAPPLTGSTSIPEADGWPYLARHTTRKP